RVRAGSQPVRRRPAQSRPGPGRAPPDCRQRLLTCCPATNMSVSRRLNASRNCMARTFEKRRIGQTDLEITTLGLGCASLAGIFSAVPADQARATVSHALDAGLTYVDTAPQYGLGRSEHLGGDVMRTRRHAAVLSTQGGRLLTPVRPDRRDKGA